MASSVSFPPQQAPPPSPWPSSKAYNYRYDCSLGICSLNCPQWCILPPPPPLFLNSDGDGDGGGSSSRISPLMAALIAVLAAAFLLLFYFTVISRLCRSRRNRRNRSSNSPFLDSSGPISARVDSLIHDPARQGAGLDDAFIRQITVFKYRREDRLVDGTECAVCLNEFSEGENLRLMPNCEHAFHIPCIDTWLKTHSNCPLCRSSMNPVPLHTNPNSGSNPDGGGGGGSVAALRVERRNDDVVVVVREVEIPVQVVDEVGLGEVGNVNLDERESKLLQANNNNNNNNMR